MSSKDVARGIVSGYLHTSWALDFEERLVEIAAINEDDERLLEHIDIMIDILGKAKEEIEKEKENES